MYVLYRPFINSVREIDSLSHRDYSCFMDKICVFCGSSSGKDPLYEEAASRLGRYLSEKKISLVYGGGDSGLMGAVSRAHFEGGGKTVGVIPEALKDMVPHRDKVELHVVEDMHQRKAMMYDMSDGFIALPGGIGTLEELFELSHGTSWVIWTSLWGS